MHRLPQPIKTASAPSASSVRAKWSVVHRRRLHVRCRAHAMTLGVGILRALRALCASQMITLPQHIHQAIDIRAGIIKPGAGPDIAVVFAEEHRHIGLCEARAQRFGIFSMTKCHNR